MLTTALTALHLFDLSHPPPPTCHPSPAAFFNSLVDAYTKVLQPTAAQRTYVEAGRDRQQTLERCVHRWEFDREKQAKKEATLAAADADRVAFRSIDWHDFVVVEVRGICVFCCEWGFWNS